MYSWSNPWFRWSVVSLVVLTVLSMLVGFVWLPSVHGDFTAKGLWASICRAAGVPVDVVRRRAGARPGRASTDVVLDARDGARRQQRRGRPRRDARAATAPCATARRA